MARSPARCTSGRDGCKAAARFPARFIGNGGTTTTAAFIAGGSNIGLGTLTVSGLLTVNSDGAVMVNVNDGTQAASVVAANGVTLNGFPQLQGNDLNPTLLFPPMPSAYMIVNNTSVSAIGGTFLNLPQGGLLMIGPNEYQINYKGGDGNDITLQALNIVPEPSTMLLIALGGAVVWRWRRRGARRRCC